MAEILGIAGSIAGLTSLSVQIGKSVSKLRARAHAHKNLPTTIEGIEQTLSFLRIIRQTLEEANPGLSANAGCSLASGLDTLLDICKDDYDKIARLLSSLEPRIAVQADPRWLSRLRSLRDSKLMEDLRAVKQHTRKAQKHFSLYGSNPHAAM